jgi:UPF0716 protein FxsA
MVFLLLLLWPLLELFVLIEVAEAIGILYTLILLVISWPIGSWAIRSQGRKAWLAFATAIAERRTPAKEVVNGGLILLGGVLMMIPGFITDAIGVLLLLPPTRALLRGLTLRSLQNTLFVRAAQFSTRGREPYDVESTATDIPSQRLRP